MAHTDANEQKRRQLCEMLNQGSGLVMIHLDPRGETVQVPPQFRGDPALRLNLAYGFNLPALDIDEGGVYAMLSFGGQRFGCNIPWEAVFAMTMPNGEHEGIVWPDDLPQEFAPFFGAGEAHPEASKKTPLGGVSSPKPPVLRAVQAPCGDTAPEHSPQDGAEPDDSGADNVSEPSTRPALRLVK